MAKKLKRNRKKRLTEIVDASSNAVVREVLKIKHWPDESLFKSEVKRIVSKEMFESFGYIKNGINKFFNL